MMCFLEFADVFLSSLLMYFLFLAFLLSHPQSARTQPEGRNILNKIYKSFQQQVIFKYLIFSPIMWKSRLCVGRDIVQVNSKFSASYLSISHQIWFEGQKSNSNLTRKHKYMPRIHQILHNLFFDKNHVCVVILKKLVWEYGMEWFGRSISICHGWARNGAPPPIATTNFKHQSDKGLWTFDHLLLRRNEIVE